MEIFAAIIGVCLSATVMGGASLLKTSKEDREALVRLTVAVESIGDRIDLLHDDYRADRSELFARLNDVEQRVSLIEGARK